MHILMFQKFHRTDQLEMIKINWIIGLLNDSRKWQDLALIFRS